MGAGVTTQEALKAHTKLNLQGVNARVVDIFSVKPVDTEGLIQNSKACGNKILVVEDHY